MSDVGYVVKELAAATWAAIVRNKWGLLKLAAAFALGALVACGTPANGQPSPGAPRRLAFAGPSGALDVLAPGDSLPYGLTWGSCVRCARYRVSVRASGSTGWGGLPTGQVTSGTALNFRAVNTTAWDSVRFEASVWSEDVAGRPSRDTSRVAWSVVRGPGSPGPIVVDSGGVRLSMLDTVGLEATLAVRAGAVTRRWAATGADAKGVDVIYLDAAPYDMDPKARNLSLCLVKVLPGRKVGQRTGSNWACAIAYRQVFPEEHRTLTAAEQAAVDSAIGEQVWSVPPSWSVHFVKQARDSLDVVPVLEARAEREAATWLALAGL